MSNKNLSKLKEILTFWIQALDSFLIVYKKIVSKAFDYIRLEMMTIFKRICFL